MDSISLRFHLCCMEILKVFIKELGERFNENDAEVIAENKKKNISFNVKSNVKLAGVSNKYGTEVFENIQLRFIDSC